LLKSGGRLEGEWNNPKRRPDDAYELTTAAGLKLTLPSDTVAKVFVKTDVEREYERHLPRMPQTAEGHWKMAEWCRETGLRTKRDFHLQEVLRLDSEHEGARLALGYQRYDGVWRTQDEQMKRLGYVRYQGRWLTPQDVALAQRSEAVDDAVVAWRQKLRLWKSWLGKKRDLEARQQLRAIDDPFAAAALLEVLEDEDASLELRLLVLEPLALLPGRPGESAIVRLAVHGDRSKLREKCIDVLVDYQSLLAVRRCVGWLDDEENATVNRAALVLAQLKHNEAVLPLIEALVTTHEFIEVPGSNNAGGLGPISSSFGRDNAGNTYGGGENGGMVFGSPRPRKVKRELQNESVLAALTATVGDTNFAFNEAAWRQWYTQKHEPVRLNLRRAP
jgi:hypothetical protein